MSVPSSPPIKNALTPEQILHRLDWKVIRRLDGVIQGDYRTLFYGEGLDLADLREYQMEDDIRHIDWNVTARMNSLHVRQYVEDREITSWFLVDLSPSMGFGPLERPKEKVLIDLVTTLARLLTRGGNRVGAILYKNQVERIILPRSGRIQVLRLIRELLRETDSPSQTTTDLSVLLNAGLIVVEDSETGEQLQVVTSNPDFRRRFYEAAERRKTTLGQTLKRAGVDLYAISTEEDLVSAIVRMAALRKKRRG